MTMLFRYSFQFRRSLFQPFLSQSRVQASSWPSTVIRYSTDVKDPTITCTHKSAVSTTRVKKVTMPIDLKPIKYGNMVNKWCANLDQLLKEGVEKFTNCDGVIYWDRVSEHVGYGMDNEFCAYRWYHFLQHRDHLPETLQSRWTASEVSLLRTLVGAEKPVEGHTISRKKWGWIANELNRMPIQCRLKWYWLKYDSKGRFTPEEDARILQAVQDWDMNQTSKLWLNLSRELQRHSTTVKNRYKALVVPLLRGEVATNWNDQMDAALIEAKRSAPGASWADVAARLNELGYEVTSEHCLNKRWNSHLKGKLQGQRSKLHLTHDEAAELLHLRDELSLGWQEIGQRMNILPHVCSRKYKCLKEKHLKRGVFTVEEDECIVQAVKEWGNSNSRSGLWVNLEKKMLRPSTSLQQRWAHLLTHHVGKTKQELGEL